MEIGTKTKEDAFERVTFGMMGMLAGNPTEEYLVALRAHLLEAEQKVQEELHKVWQREAKREAMERELLRYDEEEV